VAESCNICSSRSRRPVRKLLDTSSYVISSEDISKYLTEKKNLLKALIKDCNLLVKIREDGGSMVSRNVGILQHYTASETKRPGLEILQMWKT